MSRASLLITACALLALPALATARPDRPPPGHHNLHGLTVRMAVQECKQERRELGREAFREEYGGQHPFATCKREHVAELEDQVKAAADECRAEAEELGRKEFREKYGPGHPLRNCVRGQLVEE